MHLTEGYVTTGDEVRLFFQKLGRVRTQSVNGTLVFFDLRNRGASDSVGDRSKLERCIHQDVDDLKAIRQHFKMDQVDLIGHSYVGLTVILYVLKYPAHVRRVVQIGPMQRHAATQHPAHLTGADATLAEFMSKLAQLQKLPSPDPRKLCGKLWDYRPYKLSTLPRIRFRKCGRRFSRFTALATGKPPTAVGGNGR